MPVNLAIAVVAAVLAGAGMWCATGAQHRLYSRPEQRTPGDAGRRRLARRVGISIAAGACAGAAFRPGHYDIFPALLTALAAMLLLLAASTDIERRLIPNRVNYGAAVFAAAGCWAWPDRSVSDIAIGAAAAIVIGVALFVVAELFAALLRVRVTPFGLGDVKLIFVLGLLLGWPAMGYALLLGILVAGVPGVVMTLAGQGRRVFPYGPFLVLGGLIPMLWPAGFV